MNIIVKKILRKIAEEYNITEQEAQKVYLSQWKLLKRIMEEFNVESHEDAGNLRLKYFGSIKVNHYLCERQLKKQRDEISK